MLDLKLWANFVLNSGGARPPHRFLKIWFQQKFLNENY
jgi:hypothetical protein